MTEAGREGFYAVYDEFRQRRPPLLRPKHVRQFDAEFWRPTECRVGMAVLEVGSGAGLFLAYLKAKGVTDFVGLDFDRAVLDVLPDDLRSHFRVADVWTFLEGGAEGRTFDRVALFDVLEHFAPEDGARLLTAVAKVLRSGGRILVRVPNMASPWGLQYQYHDLTHRAAFTPGSLRHLALAAGFEVTACLPQKRRRGVRRLTEDALHWLLDRVLTEPPPIWSANMLAVLRPLP